MSEPVHSVSGKQPASPAVKPIVRVDDWTLAQGYRQCRQKAKRHFPELIWSIGNLPGEEHGAVSAILVHFHNGLKLADQRRVGVPNQDLVSELRDDLGDALAGRAVSLESAALADTVRRYGIPRQFLFEFVDGIDWLMRFPPPETWEDLLAIASRVGGSVVAAAMPIFEARDPAAALRAIPLGQALVVTSWLHSAARMARKGIQRLATRDFQDCEMPPGDLARRPAPKPLAWLARLYGHRIEQLLREAAPLLQSVNYDGARVVKTVTALCFAAANEVRLHPDSLISDGGILPESVVGRLRRRHFLGLAMELPFEVAGVHGDSH